MRLKIFLKIDHIILEHNEEFFQDKSVFMLNDIPDLFSSELILIFFDHRHKSFHLLCILFSNILIAFELEIKTFSLVGPIDSFTPSLTIVKFIKNLVKFFFSLYDVIFLGVDNQIIVFGKNRN